MVNENVFSFVFQRCGKGQKAAEICRAGEKGKNILDILALNPYQTPPSYEKLLGNLNGNYSRRLNIHHRLVYEVQPFDPELFPDLERDKYEGVVLVKRMWSHYDDVR